MVVYTRLDTFIERIFSNARHAVGDGDGGQVRTASERRISNARHAVGDGDGGQAKAICERSISNARHPSLNDSFFDIFTVAIPRGVVVVRVIVVHRPTARNGEDTSCLYIRPSKVDTTFTSGVGKGIRAYHAHKQNE